MVPLSSYQTKRGRTTRSGNTIFDVSSLFFSTLT